MNFIQLLDQRINLDQIIHYYPTERSVDILNKQTPWYGITLVGIETPIYLNYQEDLAARDIDLMTLDFVCVKNKRGNVKELKKVQQD